MWSIFAIGAGAFLFSIHTLPYERLDLHFLILALITVGIGSRVTIEIPRFKSEISISDTFILLVMLLYGGEAAVLLAAIETAFASAHFSKKPLTYLFNSAVTAFATFLTAWSLRLIFGPIEHFSHSEFSAIFILAVFMMGLVQYLSNSWLVAIAGAWRNNQSAWKTWREVYLWASLTYFAGASTAALTAKLMGAVGFYAILAITPLVVIVHFTYKTYVRNIQASTANAEQAQRHVEELSRYIAEQERIREQFSQLEKLSALGELASGVAHDFNNTLAGILGRAQLMMRTDDPENLRRGLEIIVKAAEDGAKTVRRIQDFARQRKDQDFAPVAVDQLLLDVSEITRPRWNGVAQAASVHIDLDLQNHCNAQVLGEGSELREVLVNMVFNAVDAMPQGGRLTLRAEQSGTGSVEICVSDTGIGMSTEVRSRIFDPFFTTKGKAGMGLGLAVSYGIIRRHEGVVSVESEVGRGTTFRIKLPLALEGVSQIQPEGELNDAASVPVAESGASDAPAPAREPIKILVVDDEEYVRELLNDILVCEGYKISTAQSGHEALQLFQAMKFDAVFTDVGMPGMSGWELAHAIRGLDEVTPLAVITGWGEAVGSNAQKEAQVDWIITKPFNTDRIIEMAREIDVLKDKRLLKARLEKAA
jgi:signal transduction histidine kinase/CheY-like chemotaxis protein